MSELDKKRLVIACQLSYPDRPKVGFMPPTKENLEIIKKEIATRKSKRTNYHESLEDRQRELYGN